MPLLKLSMLTPSTFRDKTELYLTVLQQNDVDACLRCKASLSGSLSGSIWPSLALSGSLFGSFWLSLARSPAHPGSLWLSLALCPAHSGSLTADISRPR